MTIYIVYSYYADKPSYPETARFFHQTRKNAEDRANKLNQTNEQDEYNTVRYLVREVSVQDIAL